MGAVAESAKTPQNRETIRERGGLKPIIKLIASTSPGEGVGLKVIIIKLIASNPLGRHGSLSTYSNSEHKLIAFTSPGGYGDL